MADITFTRYTLSNGLTLLVHHDATTPMCVVNILYKVGARNEDPSRTGMAHLFEHLMFGGSLHAPSFDAALQNAGGNNNAFTNNDITNYYDIIPAENLTTALWLESDRMAWLNLNQRSLAIQQRVVVEEFKENYLNQPYGDAWHHLRKLAYTVHPYQWPTIGKNLEDIEAVTLEEAQSFYQQYYQPANAIVAIAGGVTPEKAYDMVSTYFADLPGREVPPPAIPTEPLPTAARTLTVSGDVPAEALYVAFPMAERTTDAYYEADLLSDILSSGTSSRLYQRLVKQERLFSKLQAYIKGSRDPGLFVFEGHLNDGISREQAMNALQKEWQLLQQEPVASHELEKVKNKVSSGYEYNAIHLMNRAFSLAYFEWLGDAAGLAAEKDRYLAVSAAQLQERAQQLFVPDHQISLHYVPQNE